MKLAQRYAALFVLTLVVGCAGNLATPDKFNSKLAVAISTVTAVRQTATTLVTAKKISPDDGQNVQTTADTARAGIEVARTLAKVNLVAADSKLTAVATTLEALQNYLNARK